jgi:hypothetical protein
MTKRFLFIAILFCFSMISSAQFNPKLAQKSLVKVMVTANGKAGVCSGFIWKKGEWIVTSLHAMKPGGEIQVQYLDQFWRSAIIRKVNVNADLVLLEITSGEVPSGVIALQAYSTKTLDFGEEIVAIGYNSGSKGSSTRSMKKGFVDPETLETLVPAGDRKNIEASGLPKIDLDIIYLDGSLLPGYSGSPTYDKSGALVGIGDGGLEGGASNVSWIIPAKFLIDLENSPLTALPANFAKIAQHFSAEVEVTVQTENPEEIEDAFAEEYKSYTGGDFLFYYTKTRTLGELYNSSYNPENIDKIVNEFQQYKLQIDYNHMSYDIYEDANNGIVVAIPKDLLFEYNEVNRIFYTDMTSFPQGYYFSLRFEGIKGDFSPYSIDETANQLAINLNTTLGTASNGYKVDPEYSYSTNIDNNSGIAYILMVGNNQYLNTAGIAVVSALYITLLKDDEKAFYSIAELIIPVTVFTYAVTYGIDCVNNYNLTKDYCDYFESYSQIMCAAHLTTFANKQSVTGK